MDTTPLTSKKTIFRSSHSSHHLQAFDELDTLTLEVAIYQRPTSVFDFASILVWLIAVLTVAAGLLFDSCIIPTCLCATICSCSAIQGRQSVIGNHSPAFLTG